MDVNAQLHMYQKNLANAEADRKAFAGETQANIKKQHTKIDNYRNESRGLREQIVPSSLTPLGQCERQCPHEDALL